MPRTDTVIEAGKLVELKFTLRDTGGKYLDGSGDATETYVHGCGAVVPGLERALEGRRAGESLQVTIGAEEGYGVRGKGPGPQPIPRGTFPENAELRIGMKFQAESPDGRPVELFISHLDARDVYVDTNHPFAGMSLAYEIAIIDVREPA